MSTVLLGAGSRLWSPAGLTATVTEAGHAGVYGVVDGGRAAVRLWATDWRHALACDWCERPAELQLGWRGDDSEMICRSCARDRLGQWSAWTRPIPGKTIRRLYPECARLA